MKAATAAQLRFHTLQLQDDIEASVGTASVTCHIVCTFFTVLANQV